MVFPWAMVATMQLANANIVEDMKLGIDLALAGSPPLFCPDALVISVFPVAESAVQSQRTRWEHGHLSIILQEVPRLLRGSLARWDERLLAMAGSCRASIGFAVDAVDRIIGNHRHCGLAGVFVCSVPMGCIRYGAVFGTDLFAVAILSAWVDWGRQMVSFKDMLSVPFYVLVKIPLYLKFWGRRQKEWVRTDRK